MNYTPLDDHLLVRRVEHTPDPDKMVKIGQIFIQEDDSEECLGATVVAIGDKITNIHIGDRVYFGKYSGTDVTLEGQSYLILKKEEVLLKKVE